MSDYLYYCNNCNSLVAESYDNGNISCEKCNGKMIPLHVNEDDWNKMPSNEKRDLILKYRNHPTEKRTTSRQNATAGGSARIAPNLMKCPNCGADIEGNSRSCLYCGAPISAAMRKEQELVMKEGCPKCGSSNIQFQRENQGEYRRKNGKTIVHRTVGFCKDCGHTWIPSSANSQTNSSSVGKTILWILGWLYIFPVPLMILLRRKKDMNPKLRLGITIAAWVLYGIIFLAAMLSPSGGNAEKSSQDVSVSETVQNDEGEKLVDDSVLNKSADDDTKQNTESPVVASNNQNNNESEDILKLENTDEGASSEVSDTRSVSQMYATDTVNIREQPNTDSAVLGKAQPGNEVSVLGTEGDWSHVLINGTDGYIKSEYLSDESPKTSEKSAEVQNNDNSGGTGGAAVSNGGNNNAGNPDAFASYVPTGAPAGSIVVNATNGKVHNSGCPSLPEEDNRIYFNSVDEARASGYNDPCGRCNPF